MAPAPIVVADDDPDIRELVALKLTSSGHQVVAVEDGSQALAAIREHRPDLAVLDVMMPGLSGLDVLREVRADAAIAGTKIILLTARAREVDLEAGFEGGADDYVVKPFRPRELLPRVNRLLPQAPG